MVEFIIGAIVGGTLGIIVMALLQINHQNDDKN